MIPREILKKIRQIELRTNRIVTGCAKGARLQPGWGHLLSPSSLQAKRQTLGFT